MIRGILPKPLGCCQCCTEIRAMLGDDFFGLGFWFNAPRKRQLSVLYLDVPEEDRLDVSQAKIY